MNLLVWVGLALAAWPSAFALYYTEIKDVFQPPTKLNRNDSYFGYSIAYDASYRRLVISAPRMSDIGEVYDCKIENRGCAKISRDIVKRDKSADGKKYTHDFWFGATVKAGLDYVLMCAPRYTEYAPRKSVDDGFGAYVTQGRCYKHAKNTLTELKIINEIERIEDSPSPMEATMDSFGWSIDVAGDDTVIVGGPGMFHGRAMIYYRPEFVPKFIRHSSHTPEFNFGYAVASGAFVREDLSYAVGSPYGSGQVLFYKGVSYIRKLDKTLDTKLVGTMFGAVLCAARLVGKRTDLLVGAPTYAVENNYNLGAVYVYLALKLKQAPQFHRRILGQASGSMFGSAIVNVGDLNGDKRDEIAIGAPFENAGDGVVYIYSGADLISERANIKSLQKIMPESSYSKSFGMSLTPLLDFDENGCKELAIGSPYIDRVVLVRCMAAVIVKTSATFPNLQGRSGRTEFGFDVCLTVTFPTLPKFVIARILTTVEMTHDHAKLKDMDRNGHVTFITSLDATKFEYCKNVSFILPVEADYEKEILYTISSELQDDPRTLKDFNSSRVILSDRSVLTIQDSLWAAECAGNKTCVPELKLTPYISFHKESVDPYIIGSSEKETMYITIANDGEVAYDPCVRVHINGVNVLKPGGCVYESLDNGDRLKCAPPKPLRKNKNWTTGQIELEMKLLTNLDKNISITTVLYNRCNDEKTVTQNMTIPISLKADPNGITAKGETDIGNIFNMTTEDIKNGKEMKHVYTITNKGLSNWVMLPVRVTLQTLPFIKYNNTNNGAVYYFTSRVPITPCSLESEDATSATYTCLVKSLMGKQGTAEISIPMSILPGTLEGLLDKDKNVTIMSAVKIELIDDEYYTRSGSITARIMSTIMLQEALPVSFKTIIIAVAVGLLILIIIALVLYRIGFLQRKKKEELQKLQKSVRRQTILRRSTMPSQGPVPEDRRQILEGMKEEDETDFPKA